MTLAIGDEVILRRDTQLQQPDRTTSAVRNGMTGRVTATRRRHVTIDSSRSTARPANPPA